MKIQVQIVIENEQLDDPIVEQIGCLFRENLLPETLGLTLEEGKEILASIQHQMVKHQAHDYIDSQRICRDCGKRRSNKGKHQLVWRSLFGKYEIESPRLYTCDCVAYQNQKSFSPLAQLLPERSSPELLFLESKWSSLMSYGITAELLEDVLPINTNPQSILLNSQKISKRLESELGEEQVMFADGCLRDWAELPPPDGRMTVGLDGGYIHAREGDNRKAGWFEVIAGKCVTWDQEAKTFGFVHKYDEKPKRRIFDLLESQGLQMNQEITFISDGGDTVRNLQFYMSPWSEHVIDWFHITMRLTVMLNTAKGLPEHPFLNDISADLERVKWYLWHGNVFRALQNIEMIESNLDISESKHSSVRKLCKMIREFGTYIANNEGFIPNYGERYRYGETITTAFVESTINWVVSKRMVKKQQMRWTKEGAHMLLQLRTKTLNGDLRSKFCEWYPSMKSEDRELPLAI